MRITHMQNQHVQFMYREEKHLRPDGQIENIDIWELVSVDRATGDQIRIAVGRETRDEFLKQLRGKGQGADIVTAHSLPPELRRG